MNSPNHKTYILTYFAGGMQRHDHTIFQLENFLRYNENILGYWNYIPLVYCLKSRLHSSQLSLLLAPILGTQFIVAEVQPNNVDGQLPQIAWDWFYAPPEPKPTAQQRLGGVFGTTEPQTLGKLGDLFLPKKQ